MDKAERKKITQDLKVYNSHIDNLNDKIFYLENQFKLFRFMLYYFRPR